MYYFQAGTYPVEPSESVTLIHSKGAVKVAAGLFAPSNAEPAPVETVKFFCLPVIVIEPAKVTSPAVVIVRAFDVPRAVDAEITSLSESELSAPIDQSDLPEMLK